MGATLCLECEKSTFFVWTPPIFGEFPILGGFTIAQLSVWVMGLTVAHSSVWVGEWGRGL